MWEIEGGREGESTQNLMTHLVSDPAQVLCLGHQGVLLLALPVVLLGVLYGLVKAL